ncbi:MAG TPA: hypothetical protein PLG56_08765 [Lacunisphaera sp.]|nr:hypothetical protein [Lacunisphaera sp.]
MVDKSAPKTARRQKRPALEIAPLDVAAGLATIPDVKTTDMKVVGRLHKTPWQRFVRLQATAALLAKGRGQPKGVFRFTSHEECARWIASQTKG